MATNTTNYNLVKPDGNEFADIAVLNENSDKIDTQLKLNADEIQALNGELSNTNTAVNSLDTRVSNVENRALDLATNAEAIAGTNNTKAMTPLRVQQAIDFNKIKNLETGYYLNDLKYFGNYYGSGFLNAPSTNIAFVEVGLYSTAWIVQTFHDISAQISYRRYLYNGTTWSGWQKILNQSDYDVLFQSVSNGKARIASAITGKGIPTASDATFQTLASNIDAIQTTAPPVQTFASGTGSVSTGNYNISVSNLPFTPSVVIINRNGRNDEFLLYMNDGIFPNGINGIRSMKPLGGEANINASTLLTISGNSFTANLQSMFVSSSGTYAWVAYK